MGVAEPGEIVIRLDGARNMATPQKPAPAPALRAYEAVRAYDELVAIDAYDALLAWLAYDAVTGTLAANDAVRA
jgi:hypothetical protein